MEEKKVLFVATIAKHIIRFHLPYLKWFRENGFITHVACNGDEDIPFCDYKYMIKLQRSPINGQNILAYKQLKTIINSNNYKLIHVHTPMGGVIGRLAARNVRLYGIKVLYTAHGFHFFEGGPLLNWILFYPTEKFLSRFTDGLIVINSEDFNIISSNKFRCVKSFLIPGIGVQTSKFIPLSEEAKKQKRIQLGFSQNDFILVYIGEFIPRKNHMFLLKSMKRLSIQNASIKLLFCGRGRLLDELKGYAGKCGLLGNVRFLGFRDDIEEIISISDVGVSSSRHEGLGLNLAEEMTMGLPVVATKDRGHRELIIHGVNGFLFEQNNEEDFIGYINILYNDKTLRRTFGERGMEIAKKFSIEEAMSAMTKIYRVFM